MKLTMKLKYTVLVILWIVSIVVFHYTNYYSDWYFPAYILMCLFSVILLCGMIHHKIFEKAFAWLNSND